MMPMNPNPVSRLTMIYINRGSKISLKSTFFWSKRSCKESFKNFTEDTVPQLPKIYCSLYLIGAAICFPTSLSKFFVCAGWHNRSTRHRRYLGFSKEPFSACSVALAASEHKTGQKDCVIIDEEDSSIARSICIDRLFPGTSVLEDRIDGNQHRDGHVEYRTLIDGFLRGYVTATQNFQIPEVVGWANK